MKLNGTRVLAYGTTTLGLCTHALGMLVTFDLSQVTNGATQHQFNDPASGLSLDISTNDRWFDGGDPGAPIGFISDTNTQYGFTGLGVLNETDGFTMTFRFNQAVRLESYTISLAETSFDGDEFIDLSSGSKTSRESNRTEGDFAFNNTFELAANTDLTLTSINPTYPAGDDQVITWRYLRVTAIPEASTYALFLGVAALCFAACRSRASK